MNNDITISFEDAKLIILLSDQARAHITPSPEVSHVIGRIRAHVAKKDIHQHHARIIEWAKRFSAPDDPKAFVGEDWVLYYQVGRNATHSFYAGVDFCKGKLYRASCYTETKDEWHVSEQKSIEDFANDYMGHY